ncbi:hypothetical protein DXX93_03710 [Thalassotalea euphylliae]|uniref:Uncharacterized protein n=1 Tax=Thalassotalea euphylliae TaxID=1655234 RepID=A0A3E0TMN3_9GAMM|nr:hypothetical protein [Thalassotalea euphylliae]REL25748.1 hypothetical protein DXX93_03710 [Thalassotalea euphylliae]
MEIVEKTLLIFTIMAAIVGLAWLDKRFALGLSGGMNLGVSANAKGSAKDAELQRQIAEKSQEVELLKQRVATLERIVTDPAEQLKREIDRL